MAPHSYRILRIADLQEECWKNGGGVTRPIASGNGWRISLATIASNGRFSVFPGTHRQSVLVEGGPVELCAPDLSLLLQCFTVARYRGDLVWECELQGSQASVLNVICETAHATATFEFGNELSFTSGGFFSALLPVNCSAKYMNDALDSPVVVPQGHALLCHENDVSWTCSAFTAPPSPNCSSLVGIRIHLPETPYAQKSND